MSEILKALPLSVAQTGMWIKENFSPPDFNFCLAESLEIHGAIDPDIFCLALRQLSEEVDATRTRIREIEGRPYQIILTEFPGQFDVIDFGTQAQPLETAQRWMNAEMCRPLDLANDKLWISVLLRLNDDHWIWYHRVHHLLLDGFSGGLLARRQAELYTALKQGRVAAPCDFGTMEELIEAERTYRSSQHFERDRAYWRSQMLSLPSPVTLARRKATPLGGLLRHSASIDRQRVKALEAQGKLAGGSLPQTLIALVAAYYARATDCEDLTMVTMVTARISGAMRRIPGMMANAVPLRFSITPDLTWQDLVKQVSQQMMRALRYQRYRFEDSRRDLGFTRQDEQIAWLGVNIEPFDYDLRFDGHPTTVHNLSNGTMTDFTIFAYDRGDGRDLHVDFDANRALYSLQELIGHEERFVRLMDAILLAPDKPISTFSLLSQTESRQVLQDWNATSRDVPSHFWVDLFRKQAAQTPNAVAVVFEGRRLSYAELNSASDCWALHLLDRGVAPGDLVAVAIPRSEQMLVALLAVLKCGAAYLPLDPADPANRMAIILEDARPSALITTRDVGGAVSCRVDRRIMLDEPFKARHDAAPPVHRPQPGDLAYVIFTSGSTGRPKGVEISHASLANFLASMQHLLELRQSDRIVAVTTIAFDIATLELFLPLTQGASIVIARRDVVHEPMALRRLIKHNDVTIMQATPSLWRALLAEGTEDLKGIRSLVGGEALPADLAQKMARLGHPVLNLYGPTETTVWSTAMSLSGADLETTPPIGRPIWNTQVYVLDRWQQPVPPGFIGELYIGGAGVAKGYRDRPDLTAARFLPNPFTKDGGRIYRTGDLACWRPDGTLDYLGRNDHQIKIRGFRVEPGEIESALVAQEQVRQAVVILRSDPGRDKRLVAYLTLETGTSVDAAQLSRRLSGVLPGHMIPAAFVTMEELPLNSNGKVDRNALPAPQWQSSTGHVAPRNEREKRLAELWCKVLGLEEVSVHDNFFQLGGDSLVAAAMASALKSSFGSDMVFGGFFENPTIASLAAQMESPADAGPFIDPVLTIRASGSRPPLFCIHPVLGLGWGFFSLATHLGDDIPIYALQSDGLRDTSLLPGSIEEMAARYLKSIRQIQPTGPYHIIGWSLGGVIAHEIVRMLRQAGENVAFLALLDSYPFLPAGGSEFRDESTLARAALGFLGFNENAVGDQPMLATLGDFLFEQYEMANDTFLHEICQQDPHFLDRARTVILHHLDLAQRFVPGRIDVDMHFFSAEPSSSTAVHKILNYQPEAWLPHVGGRIYRRHLDCSHQEMLDPQPSSEIGSVVLAEIRREVLVLGRPAAWRPALALEAQAGC